MYADKNITQKEFKVGDHVYLKVKPQKFSLRLGTCAQLAPCYYGIFEILEIMGPITCKLALPPNVKINNVFHVSLLKKYVHDSIHFVDWVVIQVEPKGQFQPKPLCILNRKETLL